MIRNQANKEIASKLNITVRTVKFHISSLLSRFGVENRPELARQAAGFLRPVIGEMNLAPTSEGPWRRALGPVAYGLGTFDGDDRRHALGSVCKEHSAIHAQ